jgi:DNA-binding FrmR family transcriptional regulator
MGQSQGEWKVLNDATEAEAMARLRRIQGQLGGIEKMIASRRYCVDVVTQISAAEAALHKLAEVILRNHIETCVIDAFRTSDSREIESKVNELMRVYGSLRPR